MLAQVKAQFAQIGLRDGEVSLVDAMKGENRPAALAGGAFRESDELGAAHAFRRPGGEEVKVAGERMVRDFAFRARGDEVPDDDGDVALSRFAPADEVLIARIAERSFLLLGNQLPQATLGFEDVGFNLFQRAALQTPAIQRIAKRASLAG